VRDHGTHFQNASTGLRTTASGHLTAVEQSPAMDANAKHDNFFVIDSLGVTIGADSSGWLDTHRYKTMWLWVFPSVNISNNAGTMVRVALQVRGSATGATDSSSVMSWYPPKNAIGGVYVDSVGPITTGITALGGTTSAFASEITVLLAGNNAGSARAGGFRGVAVPLPGWWSPYSQFRFRLLTIPSQVKLSCTVVGTPL
jgi:hypothetical protein